MRAGAVTGLDGLSRDAVAFLWEGQDGEFATVPVPNAGRSFYGSAGEALGSLEDYFLPVPFTFGPGVDRRGSISNVAPTANVVWIEADAPGVAKDVVTADDQLVALRDHLWSRFAALGLFPSLLYFSGNRGFHAFWKLARQIPTGEVSRLNSALRRFFDSDKSSVVTPRRTPGGVHKKTGKRAQIVSFSRDLVEPEQLWDVLAVDHSEMVGESVKQTAISIFGGKRGAAWTYAPPPAAPLLPTNLQIYIRVRPVWRAGYDRSAYELWLFTVLAGQGWSDDEIISLAWQYRLSKHTETWQQTRGAWTRGNIARARLHLAIEHGTFTSPMGGPVELNGTSVPVGNSPHDFVRKLNVKQPFIDRGSVIWLVKGQQTKEFIQEVVQRTGSDQRTAWRILAQLESGGYVTSTTKPGNRKNTYVNLTVKAEKAMTFDRFNRLRNLLIVPKTQKASRRISTADHVISDLEHWTVRRPDQLHLTSSASDCPHPIPLTEEKRENVYTTCQ